MDKSKERSCRVQITVGIEGKREDVPRVTVTRSIPAKKQIGSTNFPLRFMQPDTYERIQNVLSKRRPRPSMNFFINEAILEKLNSELSSDGSGH